MAPSAATIGRRTGSTGRWQRLRHRYDLEGYLFLIPDFAGTLLFAVGPVFAALALGLFSWDILTPPRFVGLENYRELFRDDIFREVLRNTTVFVIGSVPVRTVLALLLAIVLNQGIRGLAFFRGAFFLPTITSAVAAAVVWRWIYEPNFGLLNSILYAIGVAHPPNWLSSPIWAMPALILLSVWQGLGFQMVIFLAGLQGIPAHLYEAAAIDGANAWTRFRHITLPLISPTTFFVVVISIIGSYQVFDQAFILTEGGPGYATTTLVNYIYVYAFQFFKMGYASAIAWILFLIVLTLTLIQFALQRRWVHYD